MVSIQNLISYLNGVRKRTRSYIQQVPESLLDWRVAEGKFSIGDLLRHLGSCEVMFYQAFRSGEWKYPGHDEDKGKTLAEINHYLESCHQKVIEGLKQCSDEDLHKKIKTAEGYEVSAWGILLSLAEHEIHHRGELTAYLQMNQVQPPQIFGQKIEDIPKE